MSLVNNMFVKKIGFAYQKAVGNILARYGLKFDDILVENEIVNEAVHRLPKHEQLARDKRIIRAADCSFKRTYLPEELQKIQRPFDGYLEHHLNDVEKLVQEREDLCRN